MDQSSSAASTTFECPILKRVSDDVGWEYGFLVNPNNRERWNCKLCDKEYGGGVYRIKQHIANIKGNVTPCPKSTKEDKKKCKMALDKTASKKRDKRIDDANVRAEVEVEVETILEGDEGEEVEVLGSRKRPHYVGPMDRYATAINPDLSASKKMRQQNINDALWKERTHDVNWYLTRWMYEASISFYAIDNDSFKLFVEAVGIFGKGYQPPSQYQLREPLLKEEVKRTEQSLKKQEEEWALTGCSIMADAWTDRKRRNIMNLCVNCRTGTCFLSSKEDSEVSHTGEYIFDYVDKCIDEVVAQNVVQVVTDNASNNMAAVTLLKLKRPNMFWTSCAAHTINLMLEGIGKEVKFKDTIERAKKFTIFIYGHHRTLALMRKHTKKGDIVRPGVIRFATAFLTLQSLMEKKQELKMMCTTNEWGALPWVKTKKRKAAFATVISTAFWNSVSLCFKVFGPLVMVLRLVDEDWKPSMGFVYGELKKSKEDIKEAYKQNEANYRPILKVIDTKALGRLDSPLYLTAYFFNPFYLFKDPAMKDDPIIIDGVFTCVESFYPNDFEVQNEVINKELLKYKNKEGGFGRPLAAKGCEKNDDIYDLVGWWSNYDNHTPNLKKMAIRILSLTSSSSRCERNWSTFEGIHTKKRNRLDATRLNNLVYVQFNTKLVNKKRRVNEKDVLLANEAKNAQGWIVEGGDKEVEPGLGLTWDMVGKL